MTHKALTSVRHKGKLYRKYMHNEHPAVKNASKIARRELEKAKYKIEKKLANNIKQDTKFFMLTQEASQKPSHRSTVS